MTAQTTTPGQSQELLRLVGIGKNFGPVQALHDGERRDLPAVDRHEERVDVL